MVDLSIIIPARNEQYLQKTIEDIFEHIEGDTEVLVGLDGDWFFPPEINLLLHKYPEGKLTFYTSDLIGQRALQNKLANLSRAKYILKTDGHCSFSQGFDVKMMAEMDDKTIMAPYLLKLDPVNWQVLPQLPSASFALDTDLVFQYNREAENELLITETMCLQGSAWMVDRETYWKWNLCDESLGSWGGQAAELGIKAYLNGGVCKVNKKCFYGHYFRENKEEFPYDRGEHPGKFALEELRKRYKNKSIAGLIKKFVKIDDTYGVFGTREIWPANWTQELLDNLPEC